MTINTAELPYTTRIEFSSARGRNVLIFQDKQLPQLSAAYPLPERYGEGYTPIDFGESNKFFNIGIDHVLMLVYLEHRQAVLRELQQNMNNERAKESPVTGALIDTDPAPEGA